MTERYDIVTIGGGLGGAALAKAMAERGYRVLVVERETEFKDRVRGEGMTPWGAAEVKELGLYDVFMGAGAHEPAYWQIYAGPAAMPPRSLAKTTPFGLDGLNFYHPKMQEHLLAAAQEAGAEVCRGVRVTNVTPGSQPEVQIESDGRSETVSARIVAGADGRNSMARKWGGFESTNDPPGNQISGLFLEDVPAPEDSVVLVMNPFVARATIYFPQGGGRGRVYVITRADSGDRFQGEKDVPRFLDACTATGMPAELLAGARAAGPLATFDGADSWVKHPYKDGTALIGDAASTSDATWGQGLSLAVRDVRVLRDALLANDDWDAAGRAYAGAHDEHYGKVRTCEQLFTTLFLEPGPEAGRIRARVLPQLAMDPLFLPDTFVAGPDHAPPTEEHRRQFFGDS